jgi:hypothetical protein
MINGYQFSATSKRYAFCCSLLINRRKEQIMDTLDKPLIQPDQLTKHPFIPFLQGRPKREGIINNEDLINLKIALNTSKSLQEFFLLV